MGKKSTVRRVYTEEFKAKAVALAEKREKADRPRSQVSWAKREYARAMDVRGTSGSRQRCSCVPRAWAAAKLLQICLFPFP